MTPIISMCISHQRGVDAVLTNGQCDILDEFSRDCYAPDAVSPFISSHAKCHRDLAIVIFPRAPWPPHLQRAVAELGVPIHWISPTFYSDAHRATAPWRGKRRHYRARFLAHLHYHQQGTLCDYGFEAGIEWKRQLAKQILQGIEEERSNWYDF